MASIARVTGLTTLVLCMCMTCCNPVSSDVCYTQGLTANGGLAEIDNGFVRGCKNECSYRTPQIHVISLMNPYMNLIFEKVTLRSSCQVQGILILISDNAVEWRITAHQVNVQMAHKIQTKDSRFDSRVLWLTERERALSTHQIQPSLNMLYTANWTDDAVKLLYYHLKLQYNLEYVSSINVLKSTADIDLVIGEKCCTMTMETSSSGPTEPVSTQQGGIEDNGTISHNKANDGAETSNTLAVVVGLVVLFVIIIVLSIVVGCFFYQKERKHSHVAESGKPKDYVKSPTVPKTENQATIDTQSASLTSDKDGPYEEYYVEGAEEEAPVIPPRDVEDSEKGGAEGEKTVPGTQTSNDNGFDEEGVRHDEDVSAKPPAHPQKDGDESDGDGIYEEAAPVIPPEIPSRENRA